jgi:sugar lactone lactonase YvrE
MTTVRGDVVAITDQPLSLGEGPLWWDGCLYLVDILSGRLLRVEDGPDERARPLHVVAEVDVPLGAAVPMEDQPGRWLVAAGTGLAVLDPPDRLEWLARPEDRAPVPTRMNDASADPAGRLWAGSMAWDGEKGAGSLYRLDRDGRLGRVMDGISIPNGPAFNAAGDVMYLSDSAAGVIDRIAVDVAGGELGPRNHFVTLEADLSPDGMAVDEAGALWVAVWGSGGVRRYLPDGRLDTVVEIPASQPSSVCLGGPDLRQMYITTATYDLAQLGPGDGLVYAIDVDVPGTATCPARLRRP